MSLPPTKKAVDEVVVVTVLLLVDVEVDEVVAVLAVVLDVLEDVDAVLVLVVAVVAVVVVTVVVVVVTLVAVVVGRQPAGGTFLLRCSTHPAAAGMVTPSKVPFHE